ncbi:MAG: glycosyltransferase family 39 protein [Rhizomicrobium sp.]|jgi:4-amino-4-deoxy-L-arabinose transferase-like glycosyltransferase
MTSTTDEDAADRKMDRLRGWHVWVLLAIALVAWLPGLLTLPALDRDESRFAQASRQMVDTGNYVDIRLGTAARYNKPIGIYWLQSAVVSLARFVDGNAAGMISLYRVPSFLCGLLSLFFVFSMVRARAPPGAAFGAAALLGVTLLLSAESEIATTDAALLAAILCAQSVFLRIYLAARCSDRVPLLSVLAGWAAIGAGVLVKGPVIIGILGLTALALCIWDRNWRWLRDTRPLAGVAVVALIVAPWAIAIGLASHGAFYQQSLGHDFSAKILGGQESHGAPPGYYLALLSITFWPATLFLIPAVDMAVRRRREPVVRFLLAWAVPSFVLFELVPTKLPHYILPVYPALCILAALWIGDETPSESLWQRLFRILACVQFGAATLAFSAAAIVLPGKFDAPTPQWVMFAALMTVITGGIAVFLAIARQKRGAMIAAIVSALILYPAFASGVSPQLRQLWITQRVATMVGRVRRPNDPSIVAAGYAEPSLLFTLGGSATFATGEGAANITAARGGLALIEDADRPAFLARLTELQATAVPVDQLTGYDYSRGRKEHLTLYRVSQVPQEINPPYE